MGESSFASDLEGGNNSIGRNGQGENLRLIKQLTIKKQELDRVYSRLRMERDRRRELEESLQETEHELKKVSGDLAEVQTTLKVLLDRTEIEKAEMTERFLSNVKYGVSPYLSRLKFENLDVKAREYLHQIESHLDTITSPFSAGISTVGRNLTPTEIQVADLVRDGKTTKEISYLLNLSGKAVEFHRNNIREKLGLKYKKMSLKKFLSS
jgi:DNA-binding CsgD family transcriptional regulator